MNILVTGTSGFIGSKFLPYLLNQVKNTTVYILSSTNKRVEGCHTISCNLNDIKKLTLPDVYFDIVFHIGAFTPKNKYDADNLQGTISNIIFTQALLDELKKRCKHLIFLSSLDVYDSKEEIIQENSPTNPVSLYGYSKLFCEKMIESWARENQVIAQILRIGHIYGPGEEAYKKLIPVSIGKLLKGESPEIWGNGNEKRAYLYIDDCVRMIYKASELTKSEGILNVASAYSYSVKEILNTIISLVDLQIEIKYHASETIQRNLSFNTEKLNRLLGKESTDLQIGIAKEIEYFKNNIKW